MHCVLIRPAYRNSGYDEGTQECLGIGYVGAVLRQQGHRVTVIDAELEKLSDAQTTARVTDDAVDLIGLSVMSEDALDSAATLTRTLRERFPKAHLTAGGNLASFAPTWLASLCPQLDTIVRFEGERPLARLVDALATDQSYDKLPGVCPIHNGQIEVRSADWPIEDLDLLPFPIRDTLPIALADGLMPPMSTSRGCQAKCTFCAVHRFNLDPARTWRCRSPENVVAEIEQLRFEFGVRDINFVDDDFIGNRKVGQPRAKRIASLLMARRLDVGFSLQCRAQWVDHETFRPLKDAGLQMVFFGIESIDRGTQKRFHKGQTERVIRRTLSVLSDLDIYTHVGFIMFNPWTKLEEISEAIEFLNDIGHLNIHTVTNFLQLSPGTPILESLLQDGTAWQHPSGGYAYRYADRRTASAKAVFDRVIWPLFPRWYESLMAKWSVLRNQFSADASSVQNARRLLVRIDDVVYQTARRAVDALLQDPGVDLLALCDELQRDAKSLLTELPTLPPSPYDRELNACRR